MFIRKEKYALLIKTLQDNEAALVAASNACKAMVKANDEQIKSLNNRAYLTGIEREGRLNKFIFVRNGQTQVIETMGLIGDDLPDWKERLLR